MPNGFLGRKRFASERQSSEAIRCLNVGTCLRDVFEKGGLFQEACCHVTAVVLQRLLHPNQTADAGHWFEPRRCNRSQMVTNS